MSTLGVTQLLTIPIPLPGSQYPPSTASLSISSGSVVPFSGDCIVNAANQAGPGGGGVDGAIVKAGGDALQDAREALPILPGTETVRIPTGSARITIGGDLPATWCIHAVGPAYFRYDSEEEADKKLVGAYAASMRLAAEKGVRTLAFSLLSAGVFRGKRSLVDVLRIGVETVKKNVYEGLEEVHFVAYLEKEQCALIQICRE